MQARACDRGEAIAAHLMTAEQPALACGGSVSVLCEVSTVKLGQLPRML